MKRKPIIIAAVLMLIIAGTIIVFMLINRGPTKEEEEDDFLPAGWQVELDELKDTTLTFYINGQKQRVHEEVIDAVNVKLQDELNTKVTFKFFWEYYQTFLDRIRRDDASGMTCDAFTYTPEFYVTIKSLADEGLIQDVSELFPEYAPGYYNQFTAEDKKSMTLDGGIYVIPNRTPSTSGKYALVRQDLMEKYNITDIRSYDDYDVFLKAIEKNEPGMIPMYYLDTSLGLFAERYGYVILDYVTGLVYKWDDPSMRIMTWEQAPEFTEVLERIQRWYESGYMGSGNDGGSFNVIFGTPQMSISAPLITDKKYASFITYPSDQIYFNTLLRNKGMDYSYKAYPLHEEYSARNSITKSGIMINTKSQYAERFLMFIDWLQSDQKNYDLLMYGKEGTHYIDRGDYIEPPADAVTTFLEWSWKASFENINYQRPYYQGMKEEMREYNDIIAGQTRYPPHYGFNPDFSTLESIYNQRWLRYTLPENMIISGKDFGKDKLDRFIDEQKKLGTDALVAEIQNQLDEYMAKYGGK